MVVDARETHAGRAKVRLLATMRQMSGWPVTLSAVVAVANETCLFPPTTTFPVRLALVHTLLRASGLPRAPATTDLTIVCSK